MSSLGGWIGLLAANGKFTCKSETTVALSTIVGNRVMPFRHEVTAEGPKDVERGLPFRPARDGNLNTGIVVTKPIRGGAQELRQTPNITAMLRQTNSIVVVMF